jgi:spermidine synthase
VSDESSVTRSVPVRVHWYAVTIFLSSAFLLVLEIVAGRLIAPYVGVSLYTWTAIIGVILAGLSLGNWIGGVWADSGAGEKAAGLTLATGGLSCLAILLMLMLIAPAIQESRLNLLSASFIYVLTLFFLPAVLLGVITPLLTTLALKLDSRSGHVVGRMHALAALGSIVGTFVTGYWLIQTFGTKNIIIGTSLAMFLLAVPFLRGAIKIIPLLLVAALGLAAGTYARQGFTNPCDRESSYFCIRIVDQSDRAPFGRARALVLDHLIHGVNHEDAPGLLLSPYVQLMAELALQWENGKSKPLRYFFAGGGAYTMPRGLADYDPGAEITVAELDPLVTEAAIKHLYLEPEGMKIIHADARVVLQRFPSESFDVIVADAFHDISLPYHLATREYAQLVKSRLSPNGLYVLNVLDVFPDPQLVKSMMKTLATEFRYVSVWLDKLPQEPVRQTFVLAASNVRDFPSELRARQGMQRLWYRIDEPLVHSGTPLRLLPVLTDDYVPVERLVSPLLLGRHGL